ncbi:MAG: hypothetical protein EOP52_05765 [Sphingobacteriales bacterium]|nr:MAG: hypothetical protein EOP52_05765 [Sphingobacteriales bacterium]
MRIKVWQKLSVLCLAVLLLFGGTQKELLHGFATHTDTVHHAHKKGEQCIEPQHHHCEFVTYCLAPFTDAPFFDWFPETSLPDVFAPYSQHWQAQVAAGPVPIRNGRGPPMDFS